jgi:hydrogenase-4 component B
MTSGQLTACLTLFYVLGFLSPFLDREDDSSHTSEKSRPLSRFVQISLVLSLVGSLIAFAVTGSVTFGVIGPLPISSSGAIPWFENSPIPPISFAAQIDRLGAFFAFILSGFSALVAIYSFDALRAPYFSGHRRGVASAFNIFVWSTLLVVLVADCISLLIALELMSWSFGYLALYKHFGLEGKLEASLIQDEKECKKADRDLDYEEHKYHNAFLAPQVYMMVSHTSTAFLIVAITILGLHSGGLDYKHIKDAAHGLDNVSAYAVFLLSLAGLGIRIGLVPAHIWVSLVHPSSPTPTHALSLGIAIKVGIYLMIRFFFQFTEPHEWWGYVILLVASVTALVNVWYAIASHDLKTALAYHSIENIGIMTAGLGVALIFVVHEDTSEKWLAMLALVACLYHLLNHAIFKGLLYMATGSIDYLKEGRGVEYSRLGGLLRLYPWTSAAFFVGAFAISGLPPLNGFVSEWLTLQTLLAGIERASPLELTVLISASIMLALSFALTAFCFYKIVSVAFLGDPREDEGRRELEQIINGKKPADSPRSMLVVMGVMAAICLLLGVTPGLVVPWLVSITNDLPHFSGLTVDGSSWIALSLKSTVPASGSSSVIALQLPILGLVSVAAGLGLFGRWAATRKRPIRVEAAWNCGTPFDPVTMQYTDAAASELVRRITREVSPQPSSEKPPLPIAGARPAQTARDEKQRHERIVLDEWIRMSRSEDHTQWVHEVFRAFYNLISKWIYTSSDRFGDWIQNGDIRSYLRYVLVIQLVFLILFLILSSLHILSLE